MQTIASRGNWKNVDDAFVEGAVKNGSLSET